MTSTEPGTTASEQACTGRGVTRPAGTRAGSATNSPTGGCRGQTQHEDPSLPT